MKYNGTIKNNRELEFAIFCIESVASRLGRNPEDIYVAFTEKSDLLYTYIVPEYEMLHTQGKDYIVDELLELMEKRGIV